MASRFTVVFLCLLVGVLLSVLILHRTNTKLSLIGYEPIVRANVNPDGGKLLHMTKGMGTSSSTSGTSPTSDSVASSTSSEVMSSSGEVSSTTLEHTTPTMSAITQEHKFRLRHLREKCDDPKTFESAVTRRQSGHSYLGSKEYNFAYCKVPKAGCTFWVQLFAILKVNNLSTTDSIFHVARKNVHGKMSHSAAVSFTQVVEDRPPTILISRDPYSRLYSAFIDKAYLPNMISLSKKVVTVQAGTKEVPCGTNATFAGFLKLIVETVNGGRGLNTHWTPITDLCQPCEVNSFVLVKQESFSTDVLYAMNKLNVSKDRLELIESGLKSKRVEATIPGIVETVLSRTRKGQVQHCMSHIQVAERVWTSFQIQGFISNDSPLPLDIVDTPEKASNSTFLSDVIIQTINMRPLTSFQSKAQRYRHLVNAYKAVDPKIIEGIRDIFKQDFILFGYSQEPPK